jgi:hypothetical protein
LQSLKNNDNFSNSDFLNSSLCYWICYWSNHWITCHMFFYNFIISTAKAIGSANLLTVSIKLKSLKI